MIRRPPRSTRTDTLFPYTTLFRSAVRLADGAAGQQIPIQAGDVNLAGLTPDGMNARIERRVRTASSINRQSADDHRGGERLLRGKQRHQRNAGRHLRSEEHTSELQSLMRISYAVFCLKKKKKTNSE